MGPGSIARLGGSSSSFWTGGIRGAFSPIAGESVKIADWRAGAGLGHRQGDGGAVDGSSRRDPGGDVKIQESTAQITAAAPERFPCENASSHSVAEGPAFRVDGVVLAGTQVGDIRERDRRHERAECAEL